MTQDDRFMVQDLAAVHHWSRTIGVMFLGRLVEVAPSWRSRQLPRPSVFASSPESIRWLASEPLGSAVWMFASHALPVSRRAMWSGVEAPELLQRKQGIATLRAILPVR